MKRLIFLIILFFAYSCSNVYIKPQSNSKIIDNVPFYPQQEYQCGPASLASVMNYHGLAVTPGEIAADIFSKSAKGTLNLDLLIYARKKGFNAIHYSGSMEDIRANINVGYPVIVLVDYGFLFYQQNHFMVVIGYNDDGLIVNSDLLEGQFVDSKRFLSAWGKTSYWTLLIKKD